MRRVHVGLSGPVFLRQLVPLKNQVPVDDPKQIFCDVFVVERRVDYIVDLRTDYQLES